MIERWVVGQQEIFVHWEVEDGANVGHDFGLLDRVNAQFAFEVLVEFDEILWVPGVLDHDLDQTCCNAPVVVG